MSTLKDIYMMSGGVVFWQITSGVLLVLFLIVIVLKNQNNYSIKKLKWLNSLIKVLRKSENFGLNFDKQIWECNLEQATKSAYLDLVKIVKPLRESIRNARTIDSRGYNKELGKIIKLKKKFYGYVCAINMLGIPVSIDPFSDTYDEPISESEAEPFRKKFKEDSQGRRP